MVRAYILSTAGATLPPDAMERLPLWRREKAARLRHPPARAESIWTGLLWRYAMEQNGLSPDREVTCLPAGKPVTADVFFSLSNSGPYALCALGDAPVGADVQQVKPVSPSIARFFHPSEIAWLDGQPERERAFFRLWTRKEAWVKAASAGERLSLSQTDVIHPLQDWQFMEYNISDQYLAALCARGESLPASLTETTPQTLLAAPGQEESISRKETR